MGTTDFHQCSRWEHWGDMRLANLPILRLSEVYLNAAEAAAKLAEQPKQRYKISERFIGQTYQNSNSQSIR